MAGGVEFDIDAPDLRTLLQALREVEPKLATALRRELRRAGDVIIADQRDILAGPKPGSIAVTGKRWRLVRPKNGGTPYLARRNVYEEGESREGGVSNLRDQISRGLKTRVVAGKTRQSVQVRTTGPNADGYNMALVWNKRLFRHPVFGHAGSTFVYQQGQPYFFAPIQKNQAEVRDRIAAAADDAIRSITR
jgi:hypothetical protein